MSNNDIDNILNDIDNTNNKEATEIHRNSLETQLYDLNKNINILQQQNNILIEKLAKIKRNVGCITFIICIPLVITGILLLLKLFIGVSLFGILK